MMDHGCGRWVWCLAHDLNRGDGRLRCRHCGDPTPGAMHLFASGPTPDLRVGSRVAAKKATGVCEAGERGIVYEVQRLDDRAIWGVIFESGSHDSFNACQVDWYLEVTGEVCEQLQAYAFDNVRRLVEDFEGGVFAAAFALADKARCQGPLPVS